MNIIELIPHLKSIDAAEAFVKSTAPNIEYDLVDIFMIGELGLNSEIIFFDAESISDNSIFQKEGIRYENLFPLNMAQEMVEEYVNIYKDGLSDLEIAKRLLDYRQRDA